MQTSAGQTPGCHEARPGRSEFLKSAKRSRHLKRMLSTTTYLRPISVHALIASHHETCSYLSKGNQPASLMYLSGLGLLR